MRGRQLEILNRKDCLKHLDRHPARVGRIALGGPRPAIFPVNYAIDGNSVIFRTDPGSKFHAASHKAYVAFEVDWVEPTWQIGWSVVVRGQARVVTDPADVGRLTGLGLLSWADGEKGNFVRIEMELISGRCLKE